MITLIQDFVHEITNGFKILNSNKLINSLLTTLERKLRFKRIQIIYFLWSILMIYLLFGWKRDLVCKAIVFLIPAYASLLTVGSPVKINDTKWSIYWIVYMIFNFFEYIFHDFCQTFRGYWLGKCIFLFWFMMPGSIGGTNLVYYRLLRRFIPKSSQKKEDFYNDVAGQSDINNADSYDQYGNPATRAYDLGRDGAFKGYRILIGQFYTSGDMKEPIKALEVKGFYVENVKTEHEFLTKLRTKSYQIAWVISSSVIDNDTFISALIDYHSTGGAIFLFADNIPYVAHASEFLNKKFNIRLTGNYPGNKTLVFKDNGYTHVGHFGRHQIFTGIKNLFEGVTICHPVYSFATDRKTLMTVATATDGQPCVVIYDPSMNLNEGRLCLDCGFTKLFINWNSPGTARFIVNVSCWLARVKT